MIRLYDKYNEQFVEPTGEWYIETSETSHITYKYWFMPEIIKREEKTLWIRVFFDHKNSRATRYTNEKHLTFLEINNCNG